jgi:hypothetical protein
MQHTYYVSSVVLQFHLQNVLTIASVYYTYSTCFLYYVSVIQSFKL